MELTSAQRKIAFAAIVLVLVGLGLSLFRTSHSAAPAGPARPGPSAAVEPATAPASALAGSAASPGAGSPGPPVSPSPAGATGPDIYQWLPFTQSELGAATQTVVSFADDYGTFSYSQNATRYVAQMTGLITGQLGQVLAQAYATPGVASMRVRLKQVSTGVAVISSLRAFGPTSITFVVAITQRITDTRGPSQSTVAYAVTVTGSDARWQVSDIELASAGNA